MFLYLWNKVWKSCNFKHQGHKVIVLGIIWMGYLVEYAFQIWSLYFSLLKRFWEGSWQQTGQKQDASNHLIQGHKNSKTRLSLETDIDWIDT